MCDCKECKDIKPGSFGIHRCPYCKSIYTYNVYSVSVMGSDTGDDLYQCHDCKLMWKE